MVKILTLKIPFLDHIQKTNYYEFLKDKIKNILKNIKNPLIYLPEKTKEEIEDNDNNDSYDDDDFVFLDDDMNSYFYNNTTSLDDQYLYDDYFSFLNTPSLHIDYDINSHDDNNIQYLDDSDLHNDNNLSLDYTYDDADDDYYTFKYQEDTLFEVYIDVSHFFLENTKMDIIECMNFGKTYTFSILIHVYLLKIEFFFQILDDNFDEFNWNTILYENIYINKFKRSVIQKITKNVLYFERNFSFVKYPCITEYGTYIIDGIEYVFAGNTDLSPGIYLKSHKEHIPNENYICSILTKNFKWYFVMKINNLFIENEYYYIPINFVSNAIITKTFMFKMLKSKYKTFNIEEILFNLKFLINQVNNNIDNENTEFNDYEDRITINISEICLYKLLKIYKKIKIIEILIHLFETQFLSLNTEIESNLDIININYIFFIYYILNLNIFWQNLFKNFHLFILNLYLDYIDYILYNKHTGCFYLGNFGRKYLNNKFGFSNKLPIITPLEIFLIQKMYNEGIPQNDNFTHIMNTKFSTFMDICYFASSKIYRNKFFLTNMLFDNNISLFKKSNFKNNVLQYHKQDLKNFLFRIFFFIENLLILEKLNINFSKILIIKILLKVENILHQHSVKGLSLSENPLLFLIKKRQFNVFQLTIDKTKLRHNAEGMGNAESKNIQTNYLSKLCFLETVENTNVGSNLHTTIHTFFNKNMFVTSYRPGILKKSKDYIFIKNLNNKNINIFNSFNNKTKKLEQFNMNSQNTDSYNYAELSAVTPLQFISIGLALIPFLEHTDNARSLMGSHMQTQAISLLIKQKNFFGTGLETNIGYDCGFCTIAYNEGIICHINLNLICIKDFFNQKIYYYIAKFTAGSSHTTKTDTICVWIKQKISSKQIISENVQILSGELSLGANLKIGYMSWFGYNYEDAIILNSKIIENKKLHSIYISEYNIDINDYNFYEYKSIQKTLKISNILKFGIMPKLYQMLLECKYIFLYIYTLIYLSNFLNFLNLKLKGFYSIKLQTFFFDDSFDKINLIIPVKKLFLLIDINFYFYFYKKFLNFNYFTLNANLLQKLYLNKLHFTVNLITFKKKYNYIDIESITSYLQKFYIIYHISVFNLFYLYKYSVFIKILKKNLKNNLILKSIHVYNLIIKFLLTSFEIIYYYYENYDYENLTDKNFDFDYWPEIHIQKYIYKYFFLNIYKHIQTNKFLILDFSNKNIIIFLKKKFIIFNFLKLLMFNILKNLYNQYNFKFLHFKSKWIEMPRNSNFIIIIDSLLKDFLTYDITSINNYTLRHLNKFGIIEIGSYVQKYDTLLGKIKLSSEKNLKKNNSLLKYKLNPFLFNNKEDSSIYYKGSTGRIFNIKIGNTHFTKNLGNSPIIYIYVIKVRPVFLGDKMSGRHGNKGVVAKIVENIDMPYFFDGTALDILLNPLGIPFRLNIGQFFESIFNNIAYKKGIRLKLVPFDESYCYNSNISKILLKQKLKNFKIFKNSCKSIFLNKFMRKVYIRDGRSGNFYENSINTGVGYLMRLIHLAEDKITVRSTGEYNRLDNMPISGKSLNGGQRFGEMEFWALMSYGCTYTILDLLHLKSDSIETRKEIDQKFYLIKENKQLFHLLNQKYQTFILNESINYNTFSESQRTVIKYYNCIGLIFSYFKIIQGNQKIYNIFKNLYNRLYLKNLLKLKLYDNNYENIYMFFSFVIFKWKGYQFFKKFLCHKILEIFIVSDKKKNILFDFNFKNIKNFYINLDKIILNFFLKNIKIKKNIIKNKYQKNFYFKIKKKNYINSNLNLINYFEFILLEKIFKIKILQIDYDTNNNNECNEIDNYNNYYWENDYDENIKNYNENNEYFKNTNYENNYDKKNENDHCKNNSNIDNNEYYIDNDFDNYDYDNDNANNNDDDDKNINNNDENDDDDDNEKNYKVFNNIYWFQFQKLLNTYIYNIFLNNIYSKITNNYNNIY